MIFELPFDVVFSPDYGTETVLTGWERHEKRGFTRCETRLGQIRFQLLAHPDGCWYLKVDNTGTAPVTGFAGIRFAWRNEAEDYTLLPGIYYDGNVQGLIKNIPTLSLPEKPIFSAAASAMTFPTVLAKQGDTGFCWQFSPRSEAGWNGVTLDAAQGSLTLWAPAQEEAIYHHTRFEGTRPAFTWTPGKVVTVRFSVRQFDCPDVPALLDYHWEQAIRCALYPARNTPKVSESEAVTYVRDWIYRKHCVITPRDEPLILNAFMDLEEEWPHSGGAEWNIMIGWCSGSMTALPLLKFGGKYRDFAVRFLDFLSTHGNSPSGVKYCIYDGNAWMDKNHPEFNEGYTHGRFYADYLIYLGKAIRFERENGVGHPAWEADFRHGIELLCGLWEREHDFGVYWNMDDPVLTLKTRGCGAGAFCVLALAEAARHYPDDERVRACFTQACEEYYRRCVVTGRCNAGPVDILEADDSESIAALTDALVQACHLYGGEKNLKRALDAAKLFATWTVNYIPPFPCGSLFEGVNVCGGVLANVQNRHVGPGICTNSARFLYDLGDLSGDSRWKDLYFRVKAAAINCVTTHDGEFFGTSFEDMFLKGMLSEQINVSDALSYSGETWCVSACWPATSVLLGWFETAEE